MRISDWSSDVCSSDLAGVRQAGRRAEDGDRRCFYRAPAAIEAARGGSDRGSGRPADWGEVIPRLTRFFGGSPRVWLYDTPAAVVRAYMRMLPRLEAERSEERRVGKACVSTCRSRGSPLH